VKSSPVPDDYEIADVRSLPQDFTHYANSLRTDPIDAASLNNFRSEFRKRYYAPWSGKVPITDLARSVGIMEEHLQKKWYGENKRPVPQNLLHELTANCDLKHLPSTWRPAIAIISSDVRVLPTAKPFFEKADGFPFDALQNTSLKMNEPIRVRHLSSDGIWAFVETADTNGWVLVRDIGYLDDTLARVWSEKEQIVILKDSTVISDGSGVVCRKANLGSVCPIVKEYGDSYGILVAKPNGKNIVEPFEVRVPRGNAARFPIEPCRETIDLIGNELIGKPYGWGEKYQDRDCSAMIRDFFIPFGIWLPRGSYNQIHSGVNISLAGLTNSQKERVIKEKGSPFFTLVYLKGHIMLYVGNMNGKAIVFHDIWGVNVIDGNGKESKQIIGKSIISTLNPGRELNLASDTILDRISRMLVLGDGYNKQGK
jgi:hypothetical protein